MLPAFASITDLADRLPGGLQDADETRAQAALHDASTLIRAETDKTWIVDDDVDPDLPDIVFTLTLKVAIRAFDNPTGDQSETLGAWTVRNGEVYLTQVERSLLLRAAGTAGAAGILGTITTTRGCLETRRGHGLGGVDTTYIDVVPAGEPMPISFEVGP